MYLNVARALVNDGRPGDAIDALNKAEEIFRDLNWKTEIARAQIGRGIVLVAKGEAEKARADMTSALAIFREVGFSRDEARTLNELARLERFLGNVAAGEDFARQALELLSEMEAIAELALAHRELGLCMSGRERQQAREHLRQAIALYEESGETVHAADTYRVLGELLETENPEESRAAYHAGLRLLADTLDTGV